MATILALILLGPLWLGALSVLITCPLGWWVFPGGGGGKEDPIGRRLVGGVFVLLSECAATAWVIITWPFRFYTSAGVPGSVGTPVAILPGYGENALTLLLLERRLAAALGVPVRALRPASTFGRLELLTEALQAELAHFLEETKAAQVDLVGHHQGGIQARFIAQLLPGRVRTVVTLGTPHLGSALAALLPGRNAHQLRRGSAFLERLNADGPTPGVRFVNICSAHDNLILPWRCALAPFGENYILRYKGHLSLLWSAEVARLIASELGKKPE